MRSYQGEGNVQSFVLCCKYVPEQFVDQDALAVAQQEWDQLVVMKGLKKIKTKPKITPEEQQALPEAYLIRKMVQHLDYRVHKCFPRVGNLFPWECDVVVVTKAGLIWEIEVKRTLQDLKADSKKPKFTHPSFQKISRFAYLVPVHLQHQALQIIPEWAGLYVFDENNAGHWSGVMKVRDAKQLGKYKIQPKQVVALMTSLYFRFWDGWKSNLDASLSQKLGENP